MSDVKALTDLLARLEAAEGPDRRLDGELDALVDHENEAWPPPYTSTPLYLQAITPRLGLDVREVSEAALRELTRTGDVAITYARALVKALIAKETEKEPPWPPGVGAHGKRAGWMAFHDGRGRDACPFPRDRSDLLVDFQTGWDTAAGKS